MNVIVSNLNSNSFNNLDIDVIKSISGEFTVDEIVQSFSNFFFNRMFLDVTAIKDYSSVQNFKKLSMGLDVSKIILFLSGDVANSEHYISNLISFGIYNFADTEDELKYLYDNPNSYRDVAHLQKNTDSINETSPVDNRVKVMTNNINNNNEIFINNDDSLKVIGFKNFTAHAGATSLIYMLKKELSKNYYTVAIEINKRDFMFYNDKDMVSCRGIEFNNTLSKYKDCNIILVDLNDLDVVSYSKCTDVIYLMESSTLMINKLVMLDKKCFSKVINEKVLLNKSLLNEKDVKQLSFEAGIKFFHVLPPLNDRINNSKVFAELLEKLNLYREI